MAAEPDDYLLDIAKEIDEKLGSKLDLSSTRWINPAGAATGSVDATLALFVDGKKRYDDIALLVANPNFPNTVAEDAARAFQVSSQVNEFVARHVATPLVQGAYGSQSYVALRRLDVVANNKFLRGIQKNVVAPKIVSWVAELGIQTRCEVSKKSEIETHVFDPLNSAIANRANASVFRKQAEACSNTLAKQENRSFWKCVEHGDFWLGNVLFERRILDWATSKEGGFTVIDWRGSQDDGYPCADNLRFLQSSFRPGSKQIPRLLTF